jgi:large subunit ribosomal protein L23
MGLLNNWLNKQDKEQLEQSGEKKGAVVKAQKAVRSKTAKPAAKPARKREETAEEKTKEAAPKAKAAKVSLHSQSFKVLVRPLVTEKSAVVESVGKYSFVVNKDANKNQVKAAVMEIYGVKPLRVHVANVDGRRVRFGRAAGRRSDYKKAIVTLPAGKTIDIHAGV